MILNNEQIKKAIDDNSIKIDPFEEKLVEPASYDIRLGDTAGISGTNKLFDLKKRFLTLKPNDVAIVMTHEIISFDNWYVGRFGLASKFSRKGLIASTGIQIDPGYHGRIFLTIKNISNREINLIYLDKIVSLEINKLSKPSKGYSGKNQGKTRLTSEDLECLVIDENSKDMNITKKLVELEKGINGLKNKVNGLKVYFNVIVVLLIGVFLAVLKPLLTQ